MYQFDGSKETFHELADQLETLRNGAFLSDTDEEENADT